MSRFVVYAEGRSLRIEESKAMPCRFGGHLVAHRGFIANRTSLVAEARARGIALLDGSDAELFAFAAATWGPQLVRHVLGEYAAVIADPDTGSFIAAHDALGVVPLFYGWRDQRTLVLATHLEDICGPHLHDLDEEYIADYLATGHIAGERTPYRVLRRLLPRHALVRTRHGRLRCLCVWDFAEIKPIRYRDHRQYEEQLRGLLDQAIRTAAPGVGKVGCELSGGLDSSTVAAMSHRAGIPLELLSVVYSRSRSADERKWMRAFLAEHALPWHTIDGDAHPPFSELPTTFQAEPDSAMVITAWHRLYEKIARERGLEIIFTGTGGDAVFGSMSAAPPASKPWWRSWLSAERTRTSLPSWIDLDYARRKRLTDRDWLRSNRRKDIVLERTMLLVGKRSLSANAIDFRHPLLYRPLVEFMIGVRQAGIESPTEDRALQRRSLCGVLPETIRVREGGCGPLEAYINGFRKSAIARSLVVDRLLIAEYGFVRLRQWREAVERAGYGRLEQPARFEAAVTIEIWLRQRETHRLS